MPPPLQHSHLYTHTNLTFDLGPWKPFLHCPLKWWIFVPSFSEIPSLSRDLMVFNCLHNQAPQYLVDLCQSVSSVASRQHLRSASRGLLVVPHHHLSSYDWRAFSVAGPVIWNWLPDSLRDPAISRDSLSVHWRHFYFQLIV